MEEALAAILDEAAARAEQEERLAAQEHSGASEAADEAGQASYGESRGIACGSLCLAALESSCWSLSQPPPELLVRL